MNHLIISREYPPAAYSAGGIGTYVANIARLMVERGETVHVIGERWEGAPIARETSHGGQLIIHRIGADDPLQPHWPNVTRCAARELEGLRRSAFPNQWFAWHAAFLAEWLINNEDIDVIEGQEWEAPLYYLLLRRALGIGPERNPPCIVHLHSPTEFIFHFSGALSTPHAYMPMKRMEEFCIRAADTLLCPSRFLARQCADHYGLPLERIKVIHYPVGFMNFVERPPDVWAGGSICFVGRLEPRKGIIEWIEAATRVAQENAAIEFDMVGADASSLKRMLVGSIPRRLRSRFRFHRPKTPAELQGILAGARAAVVPSRWENFPNVCIEAMSVGLPVIATRLGGMVELLEDGRTGWLTPDTGIAGMIDGLADALRRCLATSPAELASMGWAAADTVRRLCDNDRTVNEQIALRAEVARFGGSRSIALASCPWSRSGLATEAVATQADSGGAGIVVRVRDPSDAKLTLDSIRSQSVPARAVVIVHRLPAKGRRHPDEDIVLLYRPAQTGAEAWNAGFEALQAKVRCGFWVFVDEYDSLLPHYLSQIESVFAHRPEVGVISIWTERPGRWPLEAPLCPEPRYQLRGNEVTSASGFRAEALGKIPPFHRGLRSENAVHYLANAVMARGWQAVTYPEILAQRRLEQKYPRAAAGSLRVELLNRFAETIVRERRGLVGEPVPIPVAISDPDSPDHKSLSELVVLCLGIIVRHRRRVARALVRSGGAVVIWLGAHLGWRERHTVP